MIRCKNWLCERYNNNDYTGLFLSGIGTSGGVTAATTTTTTAAAAATAATITIATTTQLTATMTPQQTSTSNINAFNIMTRHHHHQQQQQQQQSQYQYQQQQQHQHQQQQQQQHHQHHHAVANGNALTGYMQHQMPQHYHGTSTTNKVNTANISSMITTVTTTLATNVTTAATTITATMTATSMTSNAHAVTFLDEVPSGSNGGIVNTTTRLMNNNDIQHATYQQQHNQQQQHQRQQRHMSDDTADGYETTDDFVGNHVVTSSMLIDDTLPTSKNCYRLVILGSSRVGKSSIIARFLGNRFEEAYTPTIEDFHRKLYRIRNEVYQLDILDTSGYHPFPAMRRLSFLTGDLFILVFSMDSRESFEEVVRLRENILETKWAALNPGAGFKKKSLPKIPMILAGNKCDRDVRTVQLDEIMGYIAGQDSCCIFVECSAKQNLHIDDLFYALFTVSNLPLEMAPNHHRRVITQFGAPSPLPPHTSLSGTKKNTLSIKRRFSDACGVVTPNARRPSIRTDLNLMRSKTMGLSETDASSARKKCIIM